MASKDSPLVVIPCPATAWCRTSGGPGEPCRLARGHDGPHAFRDPEPPRELFITLNGDRGRDWQNAVGTRTFPVTAAKPEPASVLGNVVMAYFLDLTRVTPQLRDRIEHFLAERFSNPLDQVRAEIRDHGIPIIAKNVVTPQGWVYGDED